MNLATLRTEAQRLAGRVDVDFNSRTRRFLNEAQKRWALAIPWPTLFRTEVFRATGTRNLVLPQRVAVINWAADKTNRRPLYVRDRWEKDFPSTYFGATAGAAQLMREIGVTPITVQPGSEATYSVRTDTSDVFSVYIGGLVQDTTASGTPDFQYFDKENLSVTSSDVVAGTKKFVRVEVLGKDDFTPSDVVVRDSASNIVARIPALGYSAEYRQIEFLAIPPADVEIDVGYLQAPAPLVEDYQVPHPSINTDFLIWWAGALIHEAQGQAEQAQLKKRAASDLLEAQIYRERMHGEKSYQATPEFAYWSHDEADQV